MMGKEECYLLKIRPWKSGEGGHRAEVSNPVLCEGL